MRIRSPEETLAAIAPHLADIGVTRLADVTGLDRIGVPVFTAHRPNGRALSVTQGKGPTAAAARVSAAMEALEQYCTERPNLPLRHAAAAELRGAMVDLDRLPRIAGTTLDLHRPSLWTQGVDLVSGASVWVPYELVHLDYRLPLPPNLGALLPSSNGLASGNCRDEALLHALCEVIERDCVALFEADPANKPARRIDPDSVPKGAGRVILDRLSAAGVDVAIWDITTALCFPAFFVTIIDRDGTDWRRLYPASGSGCHVSAEVSLVRALSEACQSRLTMVSGTRDDIGHGGYASVGRSEVADAARALLEAPAPRRFSGVPTGEVTSLRGAVEDILDRLCQAGMGPPICVDLSAPSLPATVLRVIVPGLEGPSDAPGYAPGARAATLQQGRANG